MIHVNRMSYIDAIRAVSRSRKARNYRRIAEFCDRVARRARALAVAYEGPEEKADAPFCDYCAGPFLAKDSPSNAWLEDGYGGHWDTCPNRKGENHGPRNP